MKSKNIVWFARQGWLKAGLQPGCDAEIAAEQPTSVCAAVVSWERASAVVRARRFCDWPRKCCERARRWWRSSACDYRIPNSRWSKRGSVTAWSCGARPRRCRRTPPCCRSLSKLVLKHVDSQGYLMQLLQIKTFLLILPMAMSTQKEKQLRLTT